MYRKIWERFVKLIKDREAQDELEDKMDYLKTLPPMADKFAAL